MLDTLIAAEAPEGIRLTLRPAGLSPRVLAFLVDLAIRMAVLITLAMVAGNLGGLGLAGVLISWFLLEWFYPVLFELLPGSATPGKRLMGLQVMMDTGLPVTPAASVLRNLLRAADFLPAGYAFGLVSMLMRGDFKRLGDIAAGTLVVHRAPHTRWAVPRAEAPMRPARVLRAAEQAVLIDAAARAPGLTPERLDELALLAAPVLPPAPAAEPGAAMRPGQQLIATASWLMGQR